MMKNIKITGYNFCMLLLIILSSCSKIDGYKTKYTAGGQIVYPGKMDSVKVFSGKNRVKVTGLFTSDPKIVKYRVFWNSRQDSIEVPIKRTMGVDSANVFISNLPEGLMSFEIRTYDATGHASIPVNISASVYGALYQSSLSNRGIVKTALELNGSVTINWSDVNADAGMQKLDIMYFDKNAQMHDTLITSAPTELTTSLPNFQQGSYFSYNASFLPNSTAIDTFYVAYTNADNLYLINSGNPFKPASSWYRWGILAGWTTSASVINHWGNGGWCWDQGGCLVMEMGWGGTPSIYNGKIYQTLTLSPGTYTYQIVIGRDESIDPVYIVAAAGATLPDVVDISGSLGYSKFQNLSFQFTVAQTQQVSIGFLATMTTWNQYWVVKSVKLSKK